MRGNSKAQVRYLLARLTAYVETGLGRPDLSASYLGASRSWQIEHLYANHPHRHVPHDAPDEATFRALRARLGVLVLLCQSDNASYNDLPLETKRNRYARENALTAILAPDYRKNNPTLRRFIADNDIEGQFRELGRATMAQAIEIRGELYRRLFTRIWDAHRLGMHTSASDTPDNTSPPSSAPLGSAPVAPRCPLRTDLARMMREGTLAPGTQLQADHAGRRHTATVDGVITLPSGDRFTSADDAGKTVCGTRRCTGMAFWHITTDSGDRLSLREVRNQAQQQRRLGTTRIR
ncbi:DUF1524 domain-containing protein [Streptomyces sp. NPDC056468]|uniref:restriction system modified-DNA reader domain-containing protein n=1 Tax=Streptomyces sp. NPDC056468 TaxID=3345830 RepID=UPI0036B3797F